MGKTNITKKMLEESYARLQNQSHPDWAFFLMTAAAVILCLLGFKMEEPSVIIGSMVISPLLYVIVCLASSIFIFDKAALKKNITALALGVIAAIATTLIFSFFYRVHASTEIIQRIITSHLDYFFVAIFSGLAGTFAFYWPGVSEAVAGIAISVALIPPIVILGLGLGILNNTLIIAGGTIFIINIIGIFLGSLASLLLLYKIIRKH